MSAAYFRAAIPEPFRILGLKLKPFSLGHYFNLKRFDSAFVAEEQREATREELIFAVLVCSMGHEEFIEFIEKPGAFRTITKWGRKCGIFDLPSKLELFKTYLSEGTKQPQFWIEEDDGNQSGSHWSQAVLSVLMGQGGYTRKEVLSAPLAQAFADFYKLAENNGLIRLMTEEEIAEAERAQDGIKT
jgi:hypothetical protein